MIQKNLPFSFKAITFLTLMAKLKVKHSFPFSRSVVRGWKFKMKLLKRNKKKKTKKEIDVLWNRKYLEELEKKKKRGY